MKHIKQLLVAILTLALVLACGLLPATALAENDDARYVMDAELLPDGTIGVLLIQGGTSSSGVVSGGNLYYGIYDPSDNSFAQQPVGATAPVAKAAALAVDGDLAYVAYQTADGNIAFTCQTGSGWTDIELITSNNCNGKTGVLTDPDIALDAAGHVYISYMDSQGATDDYYARADAMYATNASGAFVKTVAVDCSGWFESPEGYRNEASMPRILVNNNGCTIAYAGSTWNKWMGGSDTSYSLDFCGGTTGSISGSTTLYNACGDGTHAYVLVYNGGAYQILDGASLIANSCHSANKFAAAMTAPVGTGEVYYAAIDVNSLLFYQNGGMTDNLASTTTALASHNRVATVYDGTTQYLFYTGNDADKSLVVIGYDGISMTEYLVPAPPYSVAITAGAGMATTGSASQDVAKGSAMTDVVYTAATGYSFPADYSVASVNGVSVSRDSETQITVSGTPTANVAITLPDATPRPLTVYFDGNDPGVITTMDPQVVPYGVATALNANCFQYPYHTFLGWTTQADGGGDFYADGDTVTLTDDLSLWAQWEPLPTYTLAVFSRTDSDSASMGNISVRPAAPYYSGDTVTVTAPNQSAAGYTFLGWYPVTATAGGAATAYDASDRLAATLRYTFDITGDTAIAAVYQTNGSATVTINAVNGAEYTVNGGAAQSGGDETVTLGTAITIDAVDPAQVLYWTNASGKVLGSGASLTFTVTGDTTINLIYQSSEASKSFVRFLSDFNQVIASGEYAATDPIPFPDGPVKPGYSFDFWSLNGTDEATEAGVQALIGSEPTITLRPHYTQEATTYALTVNYVDDGGAQINPSDVISDIAAGTGYKAPVPVISGYDFSHWENEVGDTIGFNNSYQLIVSKDTTLTAVYVASGTAVVQTPLITLGEMYQSVAGSTHKVSAQATRSVPIGYKLLEQGMLYARDVAGLTTANFTCDNASVGKFVSSDVSASGVLTLNVKVATDTVVVSLRGYMLVRNNSTGNTEYYYTDIQEGDFASI